MDNLNWDSRYNNLQEPERAYREGGSKAETMDEALLSSLDLQRLIWPHEMNANYKETDQYSLQKQEEIYYTDQFLPLPLITGSSEDLQLIRNILTISSSCGNTFSGESENYPESFTSQGIDSNIKPVMRWFEDSCNPFKSNKAKVDCPENKIIDFRREGGEELDGEAIARVKEMIYRAAALRPVSLGVEQVVEKPRRKNLRISNDPQTTAARHRRERISERLRVLQRLVPGGGKMDTASMLDEAANYLKFLKAQVTALEKNGHGGEKLSCADTGSCLGSEANHNTLRHLYTPPVQSSLCDMKNVGINCCSGMLPFPVALSHHSSPMQTCNFPLPRH